MAEKPPALSGLNPVDPVASGTHLSVGVFGPPRSGKSVIAEALAKTAAYVVDATGPPVNPQRPLSLQNVMARDGDHQRYHLRIDGGHGTRLWALTSRALGQCSLLDGPLHRVLALSDVAVCCVAWHTDLEEVWARVLRDQLLTAYAFGVRHFVVAVTFADQTVPYVVVGGGAGVARTVTYAPKKGPPLELDGARCGAIVRRVRGFLVRMGVPATQIVGVPVSGALRANVSAAVSPADAVAGLEWYAPGAGRPAAQPKAGALVKSHAPAAAAAGDTKDVVNGGHGHDTARAPALLEAVLHALQQYRDANLLARRALQARPLRMLTAETMKIGGIGTVLVGRVVQGVLRVGTSVRVVPVRDSGPRAASALTREPKSVEVHCVEPPTASCLALVPPDAPAAVRLSGVQPAVTVGALCGVNASNLSVKWIVPGAALGLDANEPVGRTAVIVARVFVIPHLKPGANRTATPNAKDEATDHATGSSAGGALPGVWSFGVGYEAHMRVHTAAVPVRVLSVAPVRRATPQAVRTWTDDVTRVGPAAAAVASAPTATGVAADPASASATVAGGTVTPSAVSTKRADGDAKAMWTGRKQHKRQAQAARRLRTYGVCSDGGARAYGGDTVDVELLPLSAVCVEPAAYCAPMGRFVLRDGGRVVGVGTVEATDRYEPVPVTSSLTIVRGPCVVDPVAAAAAAAAVAEPMCLRARPGLVTSNRGLPESVWLAHVPSWLVDWLTRDVVHVVFGYAQTPADAWRPLPADQRPYRYEALVARVDDARRGW